MKNTIRLIYPQWQGGDITHWIPEISDKDECARGYYLGAEIMKILLPKNDNQKEYKVPISTKKVKREIIDGVWDRDTIVEQTKAAYDILKSTQPDRIIVIGGECSVSVVPFRYLADKYDGDVAMVWLDAHPDITLPGDVYSGYHAMAVTACMGLGDKQIMKELPPTTIKANNILYVGLRNWERDEIKERQKQYGIKHLTPEDVRENSDKLIQWLKDIKATKVLIHFDMDVLDPSEIIVAVGTDPNGMKISEVVRVINDISKTKEIVGMTIAEHMPRNAIRLQMMMKEFPIFN